MPTLDDSTFQAVNNANFKTLAERVAANVASHDHRLQLLSEASLGQILNRMNSLDPAQAASIARVHRTPTGDTQADLASAIALAQQLMKGAQTTVPVTVAPPAGGTQS